tara:strand:+ start:881 stop:1165 length:285 start_codon:yes stop_codon:yes gene_type:complete
MGKHNGLILSKKKAIHDYQCPCGWEVHILNNGTRFNKLIDLHAKVCPTAAEIEKDSPEPSFTRTIVPLSQQGVGWRQMCNKMDEYKKQQVEKLG